MKKILKNTVLLRSIGGVIIGSIIFGVFLVYLHLAGHVYIEDSLVNAPIIAMSSSAPGTLKKILVQEGQYVKKGDALAIVGSETIYAYTDGVVTQTSKQLGSMASAQIPVVSMFSLDDMRIDGTLDENKGLSSIKPGQVVSFTIDALPGKTFWGYVDEIGQTAKQTQTAFSISSERPTQQFEVFVRFNAHAYSEIKNGMSAKMDVYTKTK